MTGEGTGAVDGAWTQTQLETFLETSLVPIRLGCHHPRGGLWMVSLWYQYQNGCFRCATSRGAALETFLRRNESVCFEVSTNTPPYMGVRGKGTATLEPDENKERLRALITRYFGDTDSSLGATLLAEGREELAITVEPEKLYTWDFTERMADALDGSPAVEQPEPDSPRYS